MPCFSASSLTGTHAHVFPTIPKQFASISTRTPQSNTLANTTLSRVFGGRADGGKRVSASFALLRLCFCLAAALGSTIARMPFVYHSSACVPCIVLRAVWEQTGEHKPFQLLGTFSIR